MIEKKVVAVADRGTWMSIQEVAGALKVTPPRVRQLVQEKKLPEPTKFGERASLWSRADVDALRFTQDGKGVVSERTSLMPTPELPLRRVVDDIFLPDRKRWGGYDFRMHVRIFEGAVEGVNRTVVIVSEIPDGGAITNWYEDLANEITQRYLRGNTHAVTWIQTHFGGFHGADHEYEIQNVTMYLEHSELPLPGPESWLERLTTFGRELPHGKKQHVGYQGPAWHPSSIEEVHRILGHSIEWYPVEGYTAREIEHWQRTGRPREVEVDPLGLKPIVDALVAMSNVPRSHPRSKAARRVCSILANIALVKDADDGRLAVRNSVGEFLRERQEYQAKVGITQSAAELVPYRLEGEDTALAAKYATGPLTLPWELDVNEIADLYVEARAWKDETDEYSTGHDEDLHGHITTALSWLRAPSIGDELEARGDIYPTGNIRGFHVAGSWDRSYLDSVNFSVSMDESDRLFRMMQAKGGGKTWAISGRYGYDPFGNLVFFNNSPEHPMFHVYWPVKPHPIPLDGQIVADGHSGDRPAYVAKGGKIVGLLNQFPRFHHNGWNFGYGGGGPGRLAADIIEALMWQEELPRERMPWRWVDDAVCHSDQDQLSLNVADIMRRLDTEHR